MIGSNEDKESQAQQSGGQTQQLPDSFIHRSMLVPPRESNDTTERITSGGKSNEADLELRKDVLTSDKARDQIPKPARPPRSEAISWNCHGITRQLLLVQDFSGQFLFAAPTSHS